MFKLHFLVISILSVILAGCNHSSVSTGDFVSVYSPDYARGFEILEAPGSQSSIIVSRLPWQGADSASVTQVLIRRSGEEIPTDFHGQVIDGDASRVVCMSSSYIAMLDAIGQTDKVVGVSGIDFISNRNITVRRDSIGDVGYDGNIDYELLISLSPDVVLLYGVGGPSVMEGKLSELGIPYIYIGEYLEEDPLGKAEWMVAIGEIVGCRDEAMAAYAGIPGRYNSLKAAADSFPGSPSVMINTPYRDQWMMASTASYVARLISDAGGRYIYRDNSSNRSVPIDVEQAYLLADSADVWINVGRISSLQELKNTLPKFAGTRPVVNDRVWNSIARVSANGANDYWESGVVNPDLVLRDLIKIFHPGALPDAGFTYYKQLR